MFIANMYRLQLSVIGLYQHLPWKKKKSLNPSSTLNLVCFANICTCHEWARQPIISLHLLLLLLLLGIQDMAILNLVHAYCLIDLKLMRYMVPNDAPLMSYWSLAWRYLAYMYSICIMWLSHSLVMLQLLRHKKFLSRYHSRNFTVSSMFWSSHTQTNLPENKGKHSLTFRHRKTHTDIKRHSHFADTHSFVMCNETVLHTIQMCTRCCSSCFS